MISAAHHTMLNKTVKYPWDYRVAYFERVSGRAYFDSSTIMDLNPAIQNTTECRQEIMQHFRHEFVVSTPNVNPSARLNYCNSVQMGGLCRANSSGYPYTFAGINKWLSNADIPTSSFPFKINKPLRVVFATNRVELHCPEDALSFVATADHGNIPVNLPICRALAWNENNTSTIDAPVGTRFYYDCFECTHPTYSCKSFVVPCMKDGNPYLCDMVSLQMYEKQGTGTISIGPSVKDNYDPLEG